MELLITFLYILFVISAIVLVVVILLQEGKGGGLTGALGTSGQQTFGVGASGINKFTGWTGGIFLASALALHVCTRMENGTPDFGETKIEAPPNGAGGSGTTGGSIPPTTTPIAPPASGGSTPTPPQDPKK